MNFKEILKQGINDYMGLIEIDDRIIERAKKETRPEMMKLANDRIKKYEKQIEEMQEMIKTL